MMLLQFYIYIMLNKDDFLALALSWCESDTSQAHSYALLEIIEDLELFSESENIFPA